MATIVLSAATAGAWLLLCHWISDLIWGFPPVRGAAQPMQTPASGPDADGRAAG